MTKRQPEPKTVRELLEQCPVPLVRLAEATEGRVSPDALVSIRNGRVGHPSDETQDALADALDAIGGELRRYAVLLRKRKLQPGERAPNPKPGGKPGRPRKRPPS